MLRFKLEENKQPKTVYLKDKLSFKKENDLLNELKLKLQ